MGPIVCLLDILALSICDVAHVLYSITNFNLVISVFSMFLMLAKSAMYILHVFPPLLSVLVHATLVALYTVSIVYQAGSDMTDPRRPQPGAPWYITKSCSVARDKSLVGYCQQAKAAFACSVVILYETVHPTQ